MSVKTDLMDKAFNAGKNDAMEGKPRFTSLSERSPFRDDYKAGYKVGQEEIKKKKDKIFIENT